MDIAVYPGNFDPITQGHLDIIKRAAAVFDRLIVAISLDTRKKPLFSVEERMGMIAEELAGLDNVEIGCFKGLLVDFVQQKNALVIVRGLRAVSDFENEFQIALMNRKLNPDIETIFLLAQPKYSYLSSSIVKEVASFKGDISGLVSERVARHLREQFAFCDLKNEE